jgi:hypothetical protein
MASRWLGQDPCAAKVLRGSIESFIALSSQMVDDTSEEHTQEDMKDPSPENFEGIEPSSLGVRATSAICTPTNSSTTPSNLHEDSTGLNSKYSASLYRSIPQQLDLPHITELPLHLLDFQTLHFAQTLHLSALENAYHALCLAEKRMQDFQRIFDVVLGFHTRESLRIYIASILKENFGGLREAPRAPMAGMIVAGVLHGGWVNASEVALYFREKGLGFNDVSPFAEIEVSEQFKVRMK